MTTASSLTRSGLMLSALLVGTWSTKWSAEPFIDRFEWDEDSQSYNDDSGRVGSTFSQADGTSITGPALDQDRTYLIDYFEANPSMWDEAYPKVPLSLIYENEGALILHEQNPELARAWWSRFGSGMKPPKKTLTKTGSQTTPLTVQGLSLTTTLTVIIANTSTKTLTVMASLILRQRRLQPECRHGWIVLGPADLVGRDCDAPVSRMAPVHSR